MWIPVFLRKTNNTTWEVFDKDFSEIGPKLDWNGDEGLKNLWGRCYRCPNAEFIQSIQAARMQKDPSQLKVMHRGVLAGSLDKKVPWMLGGVYQYQQQGRYYCCSHNKFHFNPCLASKIPAPSDTDASGTRDPDLQTFLSKHGADLQAALDKHQDDVLHLLWMGTTMGQNIIPMKMLTKVSDANITTMTQVNTLIASTGGKELSTRRLKELGSIAKHEAIELYDTQVTEQNTMEHEPPPNIDASVNSDEMNANLESTVTDSQRANEFWQSHLPDGCHILSIEPDGNCFFHCISDQLNHDNGAEYDFTRHQLTNHISRHGNKFKNFLLLGDGRKDISDPENYIHNMGQNGTWEGHPEVQAA